ncbi:AI-2E family transporter [Roseovarius nitratireducens]|uniref:AI-2E family transporter n=1 Tax=Roseovarius nitratireducens TaxID=2044597 RepID=UPI000CE16432|nr:AI-2E family transporter [Roseovarius nitratireducens]
MSEDQAKTISTPTRSKPVGGWFSTLERGSFQTLFLGIIAGVMALAALDAASLIAIPTVLALLCAIALAPAVRWLERTGAPASLCAAVVVGGLLVGTAITVYAFAPSAEALSKRGPEILREAEWRARRIISDLSPATEGGTRSGSSAGLEESRVTNPDNPPLPDEDDGNDTDDDAMDKLVDGGQRLLADWAIGAPRVAAGALLWAMLTFFLLRDRVMLARWGLSLISQASTRRAVGRAMRDVRTNVARYLLAITVVNLGLGIVIAIAFHLIGMAHAPLWGLAAALANFMPIVGFAILSVVTLAVGIASFNDPVVALIPFAVVVTLNAIEANVVTPMIIGSRIQIAPIAIFAAIALGAWLWGAAGALIATPALIVAAAFARRLSAAGRPSLPRRHQDDPDGTAVLTDCPGP